jgi:hypothetical protein
MAESVQMASFVAQAASQTYQLAVAQGHAERFMPMLPGTGRAERRQDPRSCVASPRRHKPKPSLPVRSASRKR